MMYTVVHENLFLVHPATLFISINFKYARMQVCRI